jgi:hypothetical protein
MKNQEIDQPAHFTVTFPHQPITINKELGHADGGHQGFITRINFIIRTVPVRAIR